MPDVLPKKSVRARPDTFASAHRCDACGASPLVGKAFGGFATVKDPTFSRRYRCTLCERCMQIALRGQMWGDRAGLDLIQLLIEVKRARG